MASPPGMEFYVCAVIVTVVIIGRSPAMMATPAIVPIPVVGAAAMVTSPAVVPVVIIVNLRDFAGNCSLNGEPSQLRSD